jgi:DNA polymerase I-like protein with 3'-5' exonuclease and polymerase domains
MIKAYQSGDPYLTFAKQAGAVPVDATKQSHGAIREQFKACALGVQYGMSATSLAYRLGQTPVHANALLRMHREAYARFWQWSDATIDCALLRRQVHTVFGWTLYLGADTNERSLRNFPMQSHGAEMLRLACCLATEQGVEVCTPVHDAVLIHAPRAALDQAVAVTQRCMAQASAAVLGGFALRSEAKCFVAPAHYQDARGAEMWRIVWELLGEKRTPLAR